MSGRTADASSERVRPFPWHELERVPREVLSTLRDTRRAVRAALDERKLAQTLAELVGDHVQVRVVRVMVASTPTAPLPGAVRFALAAVDDSVRVELDIDQELARVVVGRILGRPVLLNDPNTVASPELLGAACAVVAAVARRAHGEAHALLPIGPAGRAWPAGERRIRVDAAVTIGADAYQTRAIVDVRGVSAPSPRGDRSTLAALGALPIRVPLVAGLTSADPAQAFGLAPGDVWLPGEGWTVARKVERAGATAALVGRVMLAPGTSDRAIAAQLGEDGRLVVLGVEAMPVDESREAPHVNERADTATSELILDAPLVVRVEVGAVSMSAREWAALVPGDVIAIGRRVSEPVVLRVGGIEVARGELVDIEGELGVRIRECGGAA